MGQPCFSAAHSLLHHPASSDNGSACWTARYPSASRPCFTCYRLFQERFCVRGEPVVVRQVPNLFFSDSATLTRISKLIKGTGKHHPLKVNSL